MIARQERGLPSHADIFQTDALDFVQINYSLRDRSVEDSILKIADDKGIAVVVNRAFINEGELFADVKDMMCLSGPLILMQHLGGQIS